MQTLRRALSFSRRRGRALLLGAFTLLVGGYGATYAAVSSAASDADRALRLPDGRVLAYRVLRRPQSARARLILVHGAPADSGSWRRLWESQANVLADFEVIAPDRLGYGASSPGVETSLAAHARSLEGLLGESTVLVGHSYGAPVALRAAAEFPDRVAGVVLVAGACDPYMDDAEWFRELVDAAGAAVPRPWRVANAELLALTAENRAMMPLLERVRCPVVVVHGTWDPVCPHEGAVGAVRRLVPGAAVRVVSLPRAGHNLHLSHPGVVAESIGSVAPRPPDP